MPHDPARIAEVTAWLVRAAEDLRAADHLEELGEQCLAIDPTLREIVDRAVPLTEYAWRFRYPGEPDAPTDEEVREALAAARAVRGAITARLPSATEPPSGHSIES